MTTASRAHPPRIDIPDAIWAQADQFGCYVANLALEHGPIMTFVPRLGPTAGREVIYLVGPEANRLVLLSERASFSHEQGWTPVIGDMLGHGLLNMDPPEHTRHRALMNPAFTAQFMAGYLPLMQRIIAARTRGWADRSELDLLAEAREITFDIAAAALVGFDTGPEVDWLRERFYALLHGPGVEREEDWDRVVEHQLRVRAELQVRLLELIAARRTMPADARPSDVLGMLVAARDEQGQALGDEQLLAHVNILLVAGHETTTTLGAWLLYLLATEPAAGARVDAELTSVLGQDTPLSPDAFRNLPVLAAAIRETGRYRPPVMLLPRGVLAPVEFGGYTIQPGSRVFLAVAASHCLPTVFEHPERFDLDRFLPPRDEDRRHPYGLVTFGGGPRICLGINFAQVEVTALAAQARRHYRLRPIPDRPIPQFAGIVRAQPQGVPMYVEALR
ncbi:MAG: cytochrome P450 [Chloroflexi bacterium]|nr:cytochrome P450 [Chloroflexota bacterium]